MPMKKSPEAANTAPFAYLASLGRSAGLKNCQNSQSITGKASILIPSPNVAEDHQTFNAMNLVNNKAAAMVKDKEVGNDLIPNVLQLLANEQQMQAMQNNLKVFAFSNADEIIAKEILKQINE